MPTVNNDQYARPLIALRDRLYDLEDKITKIARGVDHVIDKLLEAAASAAPEPEPQFPLLAITDEEHEALEYIMENGAIGSLADLAHLQALVARAAAR